MYLLIVLVTLAAVAESASVTATHEEDVSLQTLLHRIELMESRHAEEIQKLRVEHEEDIQKEIQKLRVDNEEDMQRLTARVENCERATLLVVDTVSSSEEVPDDDTNNSGTNKEATDLPEHDGSHAISSVPGRIVRQNKIRTPMRRLYEGTNIAFSAYLDHDLNSVGTNQVLVMNQVLLNDGNGYNQHTGVFTAPTQGVYSFSFFIAEEAINQIFVRLTVNNTPTVDAIADTFHTNHNAQGGNMINLKLSAGDAVMLKHSRTVYTDTDHIDGSTNGRFSTFTGFLLYPTDTAQVVGK